MARLAFIMAGGSGERFWPLSRVQRPKQLLRLTHPTMTLLEEAVKRVEPLVGEGNAYIITGRHLEQPISESKVVPHENVWAEPMKRNTLGALCWVAASLLAEGKQESTLAILTADHKIGDPVAFRETVDKAMRTAEETGALVTCGITPTRPETGYGYVELDRTVATATGAVRCASFREKPNLETAQQFVASGQFLWNSGMFFWTLNAFMREMSAAQPDVAVLISTMAAELAAGRLESAEAAFAELPNISIDFALMEKASQVFVVESTFDWDDVGAWDALIRSMPTDEHGNVVVGDVLLIDCENVIAYNESNGQTLNIVGLRDTIIVQTKDAVMSCPLNQAQRVKEIVEHLKVHQQSII